MTGTKIILDASAIVSVLINEASKPRIIRLTQDAEIFAPESVHWEVGNAFSAMFRRHVISLELAQEALNIYAELPIRFVPVDLEPALIIAHRHGIYAYDAYLIAGAVKYQSALITLDHRLATVAEQIGVTVLKVEP